MMVMVVMITAKYKRQTRINCDKPFSQK